MAAATAAVTLPFSPTTTSSPRFFQSRSSTSPLTLPARHLALRASATAAAEAPPTQAPGLTWSTSGIVLVEKNEAEKVQRLKAAYHDKVVPVLQDEFGYSNVHEIPKLVKIVVNCGMGDAEQNSKGLEAAIKDLAMITGQMPVKTRAKTSIATFKIREGNTVGMAVTLRGKYMWAFLDKLINLGLPRTRDFQGINPNSFDGAGNYALGLSDNGVFPDIVDEGGRGKKRGMDICINTTAKTDKEAQRLLSLLGMPFKSAGDPTDKVRRRRRKAQHFAAKITKPVKIKPKKKK